MHTRTHETSRVRAHTCLLTTNKLGHDGTHVRVYTRTQTTLTDPLTILLQVAHRLDTVIDSDEILVMDKGEIVERGSAHELIQADGVFASMVRAGTHSAALIEAARAAHEARTAAN